MHPVETAGASPSSSCWRRALAWISAAAASAASSGAGSGGSPGWSSRRHRSAQFASMIASSGRRLPGRPGTGPSAGPARAARPGRWWSRRPGCPGTGRRPGGGAVAEERVQHLPVARRASAAASWAASRAGSAAAASASSISLGWPCTTCSTRRTRLPVPRHRGLVGVAQRAGVGVQQAPQARQFPGQRGGLIQRQRVHRQDQHRRRRARRAGSGWSRSPGTRPGARSAPRSAAPTAGHATAPRR